MKNRGEVGTRYEWIALSVTTVGAFLASIQQTALIVGLPDILVSLKAQFLTVIWVLLSYLLITTATVPVIGRLADMFGRKNLYNAGFAIFTVGSLFAGLATAALLVSSVALLGLATITAATSYLALACFMVLIGIGSDLFGSPNINAIMSSVVAERRGIAAATSIMLNNSGQMLSISIAFPLVLSRIPQKVMCHVFLYGGGMENTPGLLRVFQNGLHEAFLVSFAVTVLAAAASALRPVRVEGALPGRCERAADAMGEWHDQSVFTCVPVNQVHVDRVAAPIPYGTALHVASEAGGWFSRNS